MYNINLGPVLTGLSGTKLEGADRELLLHPAVGGVVLFSRNIESPEQLSDLTREIRELRNPRLLLAVDQEGGRVQRLQQGFTRLPPLASLGQLYDESPGRAAKLAYRHGWVMATEVLSVGIDLSFAPVLDLDRGSHVIGDRAFHNDEQTVTELASRYIAGMHSAGMCSTGKHFPGHGSVVADSHTDDVYDGRDFEAIRGSDLQVFTRLAGKLDAMMMAHVCYPQIDERPAGYSKAWLQDILRGELNYDGTVFSDDLDMQAACSAGIMHERVWSALDAGCDAVLICDPESARAYLGSLQDSLPDCTDHLTCLYGSGSVKYPQLPESEDWRKWGTKLQSLRSEETDS
jgi:beta-N-acetylhexosaminidase